MLKMIKKRIKRLFCNHFYEYFLSCYKKNSFGHFCKETRWECKKCGAIKDTQSEPLSKTNF
jgi:RNase P subunit RPR2